MRPEGSSEKRLQMTAKNRLEELCAMQRRARAGFRANVLLIAAASFAAFFNRPLAVLTVAANLAFYFLYTGKLTKKYTSEALGENLKNTVGKQLHTFEVSESGGNMVTEETVRASGLISEENRFAFVDGQAFLFRWEVKGEYKKLPAAAADAVIPAKDLSSGKTLFLSGMWLHMELPEAGSDEVVRKRKEFCAERAAVLAERSGDNVLVSAGRTSFDLFTPGHVMAWNIPTGRLPDEGLLSYDPVPALGEYLKTGAECAEQ